MSEDKKSNIVKSSNQASHENLTKAKFEEGLSSRSKRLIRDERRVGSNSDALASATTKKPGVSKMGAAVRSDKPSEAKQIAKETLSAITPTLGKSEHSCKYCDMLNDWKTYRKSNHMDKSYKIKPSPADVLDKGVWDDIQPGNPFNYSVTKRTGLQNEPACHIHATDGKHEFMGLFSLLGGKITENVLSRQGQFPPKDPRHKLLQKKARAVAAKHLLSKNDAENSELNKAKEYVPQKKVQSLSIQAPTMPKINTPSVSKPADPTLKIRNPGPLNKSEPSEESNNQMASSQLQEIRHHLAEIFEHFNVQGNMPDWLKSKLTIANDYLATMSHYLDSNPELHEALSRGSSEGNQEPVFKSEDLAKGKNKREQRRLVYGNDANGGRLSPKRMKMMQNLKRFLDSRHGVNVVTAAGKRTDDGKLKEKKDIYQEPFDVFTPKGHEEEKARLLTQRSTNAPEKRPKTLPVRTPKPS